MESRQVELGKKIGGDPFYVNVKDLQGINIIAGLKYTGKTQLVKSMLKEFAEKKIGALVLDVEGQYAPQDPEIVKGLFIIRPGAELKFPSDAIDEETIFDLAKINGLDGTALEVLYEKASAIGKGNLTIGSLMASVKDEPLEIRGPIKRMLNFIERSKLIADGHLSEAVENLRKMILARLNEGCVFVVDLAGIKKNEMKITFRLLQNDIELFERGKLKPLFLFTKEAHMYVNMDDIDDLVLRAHRLGIWQFYVTNTPLALSKLIVRQADNLFCFYLGVQEDINYLAPASRMNANVFEKTITALTKRQFLGVGKATGDLPLILQN